MQNLLQVLMLLQNADALNNAMGTLKQQIQANSQVPQSVDFTQADQDKQQAYNNATNQATNRKWHTNTCIDA